MDQLRRITPEEIVELKAWLDANDLTLEPNSYSTCAVARYTMMLLDDPVTDFRHYTDPALAGKRHAEVERKLGINKYALLALEDGFENGPTDYDDDEYERNHEDAYHMGVELREWADAR